VIESILQDEIVSIGKCSENPEIRHVARGEYERTFTAREFGECALKQIVLAIMATDEM
jgi:hypothetical protein